MYPTNMFQVRYSLLLPLTAVLFTAIIPSLPLNGSLVQARPTVGDPPDDDRSPYCDPHPSSPNPCRRPADDFQP